MRCRRKHSCRHNRLQIVGETSPYHSLPIARGTELAANNFSNDKKPRPRAEALYAIQIAMREDSRLFAGGDKAGGTGASGDQAFVRARPANRCWNVAIRQLDPLECAILIHEGASFRGRASAYDGVSHDQV
jgi:hypothetical protein